MTSVIRGDDDFDSGNVSSIGVGQTWQAVTRSSNTVYQNTSGMPIELAASCGGSSASLYVGTSTSVTLRVAYNAAGGNGPYEQYHISAIIPNSWYYKLTGAVNEVRELR